MNELPYLSVARFSGEDAGEFLQAQTSADITVLEAGGSTFACYCSPRGQVIGLLLVCREGDGFLVVAAVDLLPPILDRLRMFVLRARVEFTLQEELRVYGLSTDDMAEGGRVFEPDVIGLRYLISTAADDSRGDAGNWKAAELSRQVCWLGADTTERFIPQMLGFDSIAAVSFSKGCYPGQEIIARARYLGRVKRKPLLLHTAETAEIAAGSGVELQHGSGTAPAVLIDSVVQPDGTLLLLVAPSDPGIDFSGLVHGKHSYPCATI